ncbi:MAG TPA: serine/threonine-protein kinase [Pirellulales bacterium]|nr:serine/threonine-protein kinase [Pirellulales bacterium]
MTNDPPDPAFLPTGRYDEAAINRARNLLEAMPDNVGPYRVLERLGGGGMGEVYRAEQRAPIRRDVALKFIKLGMDTRLVIARFEAERQALALMDHPHIAKVFDAGMDDTGRPYFVMEYVKGKPITEYADQNHLSISERLELLEQVCQAVQHAHHKGVIHRDLKPGNVLVSTQDGRPFAKVIDFGVAKATAQRLTDHTLFTEHDQFVGTPQYMSPEQAEGRVDIDTRTDVYSLGVMLYELLTGSTPFSSQELKAAAFEQIRKMIVEVEPPKPSTRLSLSRPTLSTLAAFRRTEPKRLGTLVRGELDWIVMKSLDKDRKRRYETPTSLANDIQAHLKGEPVQAAPPSTAYRLQKFVSKHRRPVAAVGIVGIALLLGTIGTTWGYYRAERNAELERAAKDRERLAKQDATTQRDAATQARERAIAARDEAVTAEDQLDGTLARGLVRPLVGEDELLQPEIETLWELATLQSDTIGLRMLDEATRDPQMCAQLLECAEPALVAAIGLNPHLRERALALLHPRLNDPALTLDHRAGIAWLTLMLLDQPGPDSAACVTGIKEATAAEDSSPTTALLYAFNHSDRVVALIVPEPAAELLLANVANLKPTDDFDDFRPHALAKALGVSSARLEPEAAARVADALLAAIVNANPTDHFYYQALLAGALGASSTRLEPEAAARISASALAILQANVADPKLTPYGRDQLATALAALSARLPPGAATRICESASAVLLADLADPASSTYSVAETLAALSARLEPEAATRVIDALLAAIANAKPNDVYPLATALATALGVSSASFDPEIAARVTDVLLAGAAKWTDPFFTAVVEALAALLAHLRPDAATRISESASAALLADLAEPRENGFELCRVGNVLAALSARLPAAAATRVCESASETLLARLADPKRDGSWRRPMLITEFRQALTALSERLEPAAATRVCESASAILLVNLDDPRPTVDELAALAKSLAALSARLPPEAAGRIFQSASDRLFKTFTDQDLTAYVENTEYGSTHIPRVADVLASLDALASLSERMQPGWAKATASSAIRSVTEEQLISLRSRHALDALVETMAMMSRHFAPPLRQSILHQLLALRLEQPYEWGIWGKNGVDTAISPLVHRALTVMRRQEPHYAAMATPSDVKLAATASAEHAFSTLKLTTPEIVEFLKSPLTHGDHRRDFLDLLECRYGHRFGNQWAFVEYAQAENLGLDLTTRLKRPDPKAVLNTVHKLLDEGSVSQETLR